MRRQLSSREEKPVAAEYIRSKSLGVAPTIDEDTVPIKSSPYV